MREQLDEGLKQRGLEAVIVCGGPAVSWETAYMAGPLKVTSCHVFKRVNEEPVFIAKNVDRHEASKGRCPVLSYEKLGLTPILRADLPRARREADIIEHILDYHKCEGKVALYGSGSISTYGECLRLLRERRPNTFPEQQGRRSLFQEATLTKDSEEIERIVPIGRRVEDVFRNILGYLTTLVGEGGRVFDIEGEPITVGDIKGLVVREAGKRRIDIPEDVIFAQGALSAIPNNRGESGETLLSGVPVVFNIVGRERRGYHFELTRTFCIGETNSRFDEVYETVMGAREVAIENLRPGHTAQQVNDAVSEFFEARGYPTLRAGAGERGFVHYVGHGIGLEFFEEPHVGPLEEALELRPGMVLTVKPGLYLPEEGFGVRVGDVMVMGEGNPTVLNRVEHKPRVKLSR